MVILIFVVTIPFMSYVGIIDESNVQFLSFFIFVLFVGLSIFAFNYRLPALFVVAAEDKWGIALACYCHQRRRLYLQTNNGPIENHYFANKQKHSRINGAPVIKHLLGL